MPVLIGTSGWQYRDWRDRFYPHGLPQRAWLEHYAARFSTVESNNAFYMLPKPETFASWRERTPEDFVMAVKVNRYITHIKRLRGATDSVHRFTEAARRLGSKLGPVLLQLPPTLKADNGALAEVLHAFGPGWRIAVEFRHDSWFSSETRALLEEAGAALCLADRGSRPITALWGTAAWGYVRFHEGAATPHPCYGKGALSAWAGRVADLWDVSADVFVYFNNDPRGCALRDARSFAAAAHAAGLEVARLDVERVSVR
ncbi:MAG TPA: DUF72 domain-containing protein [Actinomycetota bacterium]|nr:DUF72 domain-containing protein [Actinomycetota bacterium]